jgi:hypothetical protein
MPAAAADLDAGAVFAAGQELFGSVPGAGEDYVCRACLGPRGGPPRLCYACRQLFLGLAKGRPQGSVALARGRADRADRPPRRLVTRIVPMTAALNPSPWYTRLATYKRGNPELAPLLGALAATFLETHAGPIGALLGGAPTQLTTVPSKRGISYADQPLRRALAHFSPVRRRLAPVLAFDPTGAAAGHGRYTPGCFKLVGSSPVGERIVLIEDTWVTGATALSAAGALLAHGAAAIAILPLARCLDASYWGELHPYRAAANRPYRAAFWPRP